MCVCVCVVRYSITSCYLLWFVFTVCEVNFAIYTYWVDSFWIIVLSWCIVSQHIVCVVSYVLMLYFVTFYFTKLHVFIQHIAFSFHALYMVLIIFQYFIDWLIQYIAMHLVVMCYCRRKFRSQTSDNMDRWKAELGRVREEKRRRKRKSQRKEDPGARKDRKVAKHCVFPVATEGRKVGSLKRRVRSQLARWEMKNCTPLWREAHFQVKSVKNWRARTTFGSWDVEKVPTVVAGSTFPSQSIQNTQRWDRFWKLRYRKSAHFEVKMLKPHARTTFWRSDVVSRGRRKGLCSLSCQNWTKRDGFVAFPKTMAGVGHLKRICRDAFSVAGAVQETCSSGLLGGPGAGCILEHQIFRFAEMILRDRCSTSYDLASLFRGRSSTLDRWWKNRKTHSYEAVSSALNFPCLKEISQKCFVFDVVNFKRWGSLADMLRFRRCQVEKLRTSRRIAAFLMLSSSKTEEVSQNSFVFKLADRQIDRETTATTTTSTNLLRYITQH